MSLGLEDLAPLEEGDALGGRGEAGGPVGDGDQDRIWRDEVADEGVDLTERGGRGEVERRGVILALGQVEAPGDLLRQPEDLAGDDGDRGLQEPR